MIVANMTLTIKQSAKRHNQTIKQSNFQMKITNVEAYWLRCPIPEKKQHRSDYGLLTDFDMTLVVVTTDNGLQGFGEAKAAVGSSGVCASIVSRIENE